MSEKRPAHPLWILGVVMMIAGGVVCVAPPDFGSDSSGGGRSALDAVDLTGGVAFVLVALGAVVTVAVFAMSRRKD